VRACGSLRSGAVLHVGQDVDGMAVGRRARAGPGARRLGRCLRGGDPFLRHLRVRVENDLPGGSVDEKIGAGIDIVEARAPDHAGDAELAGDDRGVARDAAQRGGDRGDDGRVESGGVGRREVVGAQDARRLRRRDAGLGLAGQLGHHAVADVVQVADPFGHQPACATEHVTELLDRGHRGRRESVAGAELGRHQADEAAVAGEGGRRNQHLGGRPAGKPGALLEPLGNSLGGGAEPFGALLR
jgi:hypothetical protein